MNKFYSLSVKHIICTRTPFLLPGYSTGLLALRFCPLGFCPPGFCPLGFCPYPGDTAIDRYRPTDREGLEAFILSKTGVCRGEPAGHAPESRGRSMLTGALAGARQRADSLISLFCGLISLIVCFDFVV